MSPLLNSSSNLWLMWCVLPQDYSVPEISLFPEENAEGKKVVFRDTSDDARIFGLPIKANSIIINAGLWVANHERLWDGAMLLKRICFLSYSNSHCLPPSHPLRWLVYAHPFFQGVPRILEVGGYSNPAAWGVEQPYVASLHPLKVVSVTFVILSKHIPRSVHVF